MVSVLYLSELCIYGKSFLPHKPLNIYSKGSSWEIMSRFISFRLTGNFRGWNYAHKPMNYGYFIFTF